MKKLLCLCMFLCLLVGCQTKEKEEKKERPAPVQLNYSYQFEPYEMSDDYNQLLQQYPNSNIYLLHATNNQLFLAFSDPNSVDQVGRTIALYSYDLETKVLINVLPEIEAENILINDALMFNDTLIYMIRDKEQQTFSVIAKTNDGEKKELFKETNIGFMQPLNFEVGENSLYFSAKKDMDDNNFTLYYKEITKELEVKDIFEKNVEQTPKTNFIASKDRAVFKDGEDYRYFEKGEAYDFKYTKNSTAIGLTKDYIFLNEKEYYDISAKEIKNSTDNLPKYPNSSYVYDNTTITVEDKEIIALEFFNGTMNTKTIYPLAEAEVGLRFLPIKDNEVFIAMVAGKADFDFSFFRLKINVE